MRFILCIMLLFSFVIPASAEGISRLNVNLMFRHVKVEGGKGNYLVIGEARSEKGLFFYTVEDGHIDLVKEKRVRISRKDLDWESFSISICLPNERLPKNGTLTLNLYQKNANHKIIHNYPVFLERFP